MIQTENAFIGILGDGQLARMLCQEAHKLNISTAVLTTSKDSPASLVNSNIFLASEINLESVIQFSKFCLNQNPKAILTIESEFIDPEYLIQAEDKTNIKVFPSVDNLKTIRDRKPQKQFLMDHNLPTSPLVEFKNIQGLNQILNVSNTNLKPETNLKSSNQKLVLKKRLFGYDGYGTIILNNVHDLPKLPKDFNANDWICEHFIEFKRELAISFARNQQGQTCIFPWVETFQENSKCLWVKGPLNTTNSMKTLQKKISDALDKINYQGFVTFEIFETKKEDLLINEVAPRVHNSAHYSLEALYLNQFKAHLIAGLNLELPQKPKVISPFAMYNLIASKEINNPKIPQDSSEYFLNWYQKSQSRPGRKMGHITCLALTFDDALVSLKNKVRDFDL